MARRKWTIRKSVMGNDRVSASYLIERAEPQGRSMSAGYRFAKVSRDDASTFRSETDAQKILRSIRQRARDAEYEVITL